MESALTSPVVKSFMCGMFSGTCSTLLFQPLDLVKTRLQVSVNVGGRVGMVTIFCNVVQQDTMRGLWKGLVPSISRGVPGIAIYFSGITALKGKFEEKGKKPNPLKSVLIGAVARATSGITVMPFTVLKTRFESGKFNYSSMFGALNNIIKTEGVKTLFSGLSPTLARDVPFSGLYFMFYSQLKSSISGNVKNENLLPAYHFMSGVAAGMMASMITQPADVVKTHMQLEPLKYKKLKQTLQIIYQKDGFNGFLRGMVPRALRRTLMAAMAWTIYEEVSKKCGLK
ncbi:SLC25A38 [Mytilus coruscus]|uniref:Mitochondrial glycine transporter n=1 Tax=Mytilus coruscus TaxID=42192 RepID=A0A6J8A739_MYTCO|nr:SLC25A38 [Mytilus coruscus]